MEEIRLVNNTEGSVVSDVMLATLNAKVDTLNECAVELGKVKGELELANRRYADLEKKTKQEVQDAQEKVWVTIKTKDAAKIYKDPWGAIIDFPSEIESLEVSKAQLSDLANAAVKAQAIKDVEAAKKAQEEAEKLAETANKDAVEAEAKAEKRIELLKKVQKEEIDKAITKAERDNLDEIADLKLEVKALNKENDLMQDEAKQVARERAFIIEGFEKELELKNSYIRLLEEGTKGVLDRVRWSLRWFRNRLTRV